MKITNLRRFVLLCAVTIFTNLSIAKAENIAVLDLDNVIKNCDAMKDAQKKLTKKQAEFQKEVDAKQAALESEGKKLNSKKSTLTKEAFDKEQEKFSEKVDTLKKLVDQRQNTLKKASVDTLSKLNDKVKDVIEGIKEEKKLDLILSGSNVIFYRDSLDISSEVLKGLNKKISKIEIKFE